MSTAKAIGSGRAGPVRTAVRRMLAEARRSNAITLEHEVRASLAERYADIVDRSAKSEDDAALLKAGDKLLEVLDTLPVRSSGGEGHDDGSPRGKLHAIMDGGPTVGDAANA